MPYTVADLMSPEPLTIAPSAGLNEAERLMTAHGIRHLPVVDGGQVVGLITLPHLLQARAADAWTARVDAWMQPGPRTIRPDTPLRKAAGQLLEEKVGCILVLDDAPQLVGLLTDSDFVRFALEVIDDFDRAANGLQRLAELAPE